MKKPHRSNPIYLLASAKGQFVLAVPNAEEVEEFRRLYKAQFSIDLNSEEALEVATSYLQIYQLLTYEP